MTNSSKKSLINGNAANSELKTSPKDSKKALGKVCYDQFARKHFPFQNRPSLKTSMFFSFCSLLFAVPVVLGLHMSFPS